VCLLGSAACEQARLPVEAVAFRREAAYGAPAGSGLERERPRRPASSRRGRFLEEDLLDADPADFCIGVAGYPERHFESPHLITDVRATKDKVDAGGHYIVTQMFFDNQHYFRFVELCRAEGITVPIIPGLKVLSSAAQLKTIPRNFHVEIPLALADTAAKAAPEHTLDVGVEWCTGQVRELLAAGAPAVHFYIMQSAKAVTRVLEQVKP
jgi:methylenetetrahydrofolate reductase (NADPH)